MEPSATDAKTGEYRESPPAPSAARPAAAAARRQTEGAPAPVIPDCCNIGVALRAKTHFARLTAMGIVVAFALYVLINTGMVMGLAPVVGVPLPLVSYGGTVMLTIMAGFGIVMSAHASRDHEGLS